MITKLRFKFELYTFYFKKNLPYLIIGLAIGIISVIYQKEIYAFYSKFSRPVVKIGIEGLYTINTLPPQVSNLISYGLTEITQNQKSIISPIVKDLSVNQDKNEYIFKLNTEKTWHNGDKLNSNQLDYNIPGLTFTTPSPDTLIVISDKPFAPLESTLSKPIFKSGLIGLGEYSVKNIKFQDGYINELNLDSKTNPSINFHFYQNQADLISAFKIGQVDQVTLDNIPVDLESGWEINVAKNIATDIKYSAIFINTQKLNNKQLRQALAYATPKSNDKNDRCLSPISSTSWAYNPNVKEYNFNPTRARELFADNKIDSINLSVGDRNLLATAENIKKSWEEILKIKVNLTVGQIDQQNFDVIIHYGSIPADPDQYVFWHSTQTKSNITKLNNPKIDKLLEDGRATFDIIERKKIYQEFQKALLEESPAIFLTYPTQYTVTRVK